MRTYSIIALACCLMAVGCSKSENENAAIPATGDGAGTMSTSPAPPSVPAKAELDLPPDLAGLIATMTVENAMDVMETLKTDPVRWRKQMPPFFRAWGALDPNAAIREAKKIKGSPALSAMSMTLAGWSMLDFEGARTWVDENLPPESSATSRYAKSILNHIPEEELGNAAEWIEEKSSNSPVILTQYAKRLGDLSPDTALDWAGELNVESKTHRSVTDMIVRGWCKEDAGECSGYLNNMPETPFRDQAIASFVRAIADVDREAAQEWATAVVEPDLRASLKKQLSISAILNGSPGEMLTQ